ncbi:MAG: carboxypeptidase-like regulatory domain-containing protein [Terriglobia bacterium]
MLPRLGSNGPSWLLLLLVFSFCALTATTAQAQLYTASLTGVVRDHAGAVVPGAHATVTNEQNGYKYSAVTDGAGRYVIRNLSPGNYRLSVSASGMQHPSGRASR